MFIDRLAMALNRAKRENLFAAVLCLDLDDFKPVNDNYGHQAGDEVLKIVAQRLLSCVRESDTVARLGGDEFAVVLGGLSNPRYAAVVAEKIVHAISETMRLAAGQQCSVGVSIGISIFPEDAKDIDRLQAYADHAMYESKRAGKNRYSFFENTDQGNPKNPVWLEFKDEYLCGIRQLDQQHRLLANLLNRVNLAIDTDEPAEIIVELFDRLLDETGRHFATEDELLKRYQFPNHENHHAEHCQLLFELKGLTTNFDNQGGASVVLQRLKTWLIDHLLHGDRESCQFLLAHGAK